MKFWSILFASLVCLVLTGCLRDGPSTVPLIGKVYVTVLDQSRNPVVGAMVQLRTPEDYVYTQEPTNAQGMALFDLDPGTWRVQIVVPEEYEVPTGAINPQVITLGLGDPFPVDFTLNQRNPDSLAGTVSFGWEWASFLSCGQQQWWSIASGAEASRVAHGWRDARFRGAHEVWVVARGLIRSPGEYGREVRVSAVQEVREYRASDCPERRVSVAPRTTLIAPGDTLRIDLAVYDEAGNRINPLDIVWTSSDPSVATVEYGLVNAKQRGLTRIIASMGSIADTALIQVQWPWYMAGFALISGTVRNPNGSPAANVTLYVTCHDWAVTPNTDASGNFELLVSTPPIGYSGLTDERAQACRVQTSVPNDTIPAVAFLTAVYSRPGVTGQRTQVQLQRARRSGTLQLQADSGNLVPGSAMQVRVTQNGAAVDNVRFRSLLSDVASVDATGRVTARIPGTTTVIATSLADSTVIGWLDFNVRRF